MLLSEILWEDEDGEGKAYDVAIGKEIRELALEGDVLVFVFTDGTRLELYDDGQQCCEERFMVCDDDLSIHAGSRLMGFQVARAPDLESEAGVEEVQFLRVTTSEGGFEVRSHNRHNGYYGGFRLRARFHGEQA